MNSRLSLRDRERIAGISQRLIGMGSVLSLLESGPRADHQDLAIADMVDGGFWLEKLASMIPEDGGEQRDG